MLINIVFAAALLSSFPACTPPDKADGGAQAAAARLAGTLESVSSVSFYFVSRTGKYSFRGDRFKVESSVEVHRKCGANCRYFMADVISHLEESTLAECLSGQENVLIAIGGVETVLYSHSGRMIELNGKCYFNKEGIGDRIKDAKFLFN